jgi:hypothetical protein
MAISLGDDVLLDLLGGLHFGPPTQGVAATAPADGAVDVVWRDGAKTSGVPVDTLKKLSDPTDLVQVRAKYLNHFVRLKGAPEELQGLLVGLFLAEPDDASSQEARVVMMLVARDGSPTGTVFVLELGVVAGGAILPVLDAAFAVLPNSASRR